ncbi:MAG TPA: hypothetical protein VKN14_06760 [Flavobacteriaceae bacterium]|nr:hypothetical protein [Flavobacteriaceae bacterium]
MQVKTMKLKLYDQETKELTEHNITTLNDILNLARKFKEITVINQTDDDKIGPEFVGDEFVLFKYDSNSPARRCADCHESLNIFNLETCEVCESEYCSDCMEQHNCL